ncbi:MAG: deoxyribonuclease IV [Candidatus Babeliales bacterium]|jgi:deoxyribonuclease-4
MKAHSKKRLDCNHNLGIHLRLEGSLAQLVATAQAYGLTTFQFFLIVEGARKHIAPSPQEIEAFVRARQTLFGPVYVHSSYWINPASSNKSTFLLSRALLKKELVLAQALDVNFLVLHAGSAKGYRPTASDPTGKQRAISTLAKMLNNLMKYAGPVTILLENTAHGKKTIGSELEDFALLKSYLNFPEKVGFCLDTAHAFSYGYDIELVDDFLAKVDQTMGLNALKLIHFNDTHDAKGDRLDQHAFPGQGNIGKPTLQALLHHPLLAAVPKVIEGSSTNQNISNALFDDICAW